MRIVAISDTHNQLDKINIPDGDVLVHAGDATYRGQAKELEKFNIDLGLLPHSNKIFVPGNHDLLFENSKQKALNIIDSATVLIDEELVINDIKFYGSPWQPVFGNWAFNLPRGKALKNRWDLIPKDTDILITHSPPHGILDDTFWSKENVGCEELAKRVLRVSPKVNIFGHIHESRGHLNFSGIDFINASICTLQYVPSNKPYIIDIDSNNSIKISES